MNHPLERWETLVNKSCVLLPPSVNLPTLLGGPQEINHSWCELSITIENTGSVMLDNHKLELAFSSDEIEEVDDMVHLGVFDSDMLKKMKLEKQEVFEYKDDPYALVIEPHKPLVEKDSMTFRFAILPIPESKEVNIHWDYLSNGFNKEGDIKLEVVPIYKDIEITEATESFGEIPESRTEIMHYII